MGQICPPLQTPNMASAFKTRGCCPSKMRFAFKSIGCCSGVVGAILCHLFLLTKTPKGASFWGQPLTLRFRLQSANGKISRFFTCVALASRFCQIRQSINHLAELLVGIGTHYAVNGVFRNVKATVLRELPTLRHVVQ